jgi:hypothetical protein
MLAREHARIEAVTGGSAKATLDDHGEGFAE